MKALVTGFDPFGGDEVNPSSLAVGKLKKRIGGIAVHTAKLPTSYAQSAGVLRAAIDKVRPDIVLCVGQAGGRSELCLERVGINVQDARIRDNDGKQPIDKPVVKDGPAALFRHPADQGLRGGDAQGGPAGGGVEHRRHLRLQPHPLFADGHRPGPSRRLPRRLPAHPLRARAGRPRRRCAVDGARRHRARHRDHPARSSAPAAPTDIHTSKGTVS